MSIQTLIIAQPDDIDALPLEKRFDKRTVPGKITELDALIDNRYDWFFDTVLRSHTVDMINLLAEECFYEFKGSYRGVMGAYNHEIQNVLVFQRPHA